MEAEAPSSPLPLVVHLGFAGARRFLPKDALPEQEKAFQSALRPLLVARLRRLHDDLKLSKQHFFCGISQIAAGADMLFTSACAELKIPQRIFLPQPRTNYLEAQGSSGPDFTNDEKDAAKAFLDAPGTHVFDEHVVSRSDNRHIRLEETNVEIVRASNLLVCLTRPEDEGKRGGTSDVIDRALARPRPVLKIIVSNDNGTPRLEEQWLSSTPFEIPSLPHALKGAAPMSLDDGLPDISTYTDALKRYASSQAKEHSRFFKFAARVIIGTHIVATVCAVLALAGREMADFEHLLMWILGLELVLLGIGFATHQRLHHRHAAREWATHRLVAEVISSVQAVRHRHLYLEHLFHLPLPDEFRALARTLNDLHLRSTRPLREGDWKEARDVYVKARLGDPDSKVKSRGQIPFYKARSSVAGKRLRLAQMAFTCFSVAAVTLAFLKLVIHLSECLPAEPYSLVCGSLAIILPVLAVGALSLAGALDLEAAFHTYSEMSDFLTRQKALLDKAGSGHELDSLVLETEYRLLGETVTWFSRRAYMGVA